MDSVALLHALAQRCDAQPLRAVHVHHGLSQHADRWAAHCQKLCDGLGIALHIAHVQVDRASGLGLEGAARQARHAVFAEHLANGEVLVTAHHQRDQAETFLLRALRGSGVDGLAAMQAWRLYGRGYAWRPLLNTPYQRLQEYANAHDLTWVEDASNADARFDRNFLRQQVLPLLTERWPQAEAALARSAALANQARSLLEHDDAIALAHARSLDDHVLRTPALQRLPHERRARVLRRWINELGLPPLPANGVQQVQQSLDSARIDSQFVFDWHGARLYHWQDLLHADVQRMPLPRTYQADWDGRQALNLPDGSQLHLQGAPALPWPAQVQARQGGERMQLPGREHQHWLKHLLQQLHIPPWERAHLPLLFDHNKQLMAVGDLLYADAFDQWLRKHHARLQWQRIGA